MALAVSASIVARLSRPAMRLQPLTPAEQEVKDAVRRLWQQEDDAAAAGDQQALDAVFDLSTTDGQEAVRHAEARLAFVQAWAQARGVTWRPPAVSVRTPRIRFGGGSPPATVDVTAVVSESWTYVYNGTGQAQAFGLGRELDQDTRTPGPAVPSPAGPLSPTSGTASGGVAPANAAIANVGKTAGYDRAGAVAYADRYCGAAPGCGNGGWYNPRFHDYNGEGGDCTNFISQVLSLGGGLRETSEWTYDRRTGEGTAAWVKSGSLVSYLLGTGLARVVVRGTYLNVVTATTRLLPGDVIAYFEKGAIQHLAVVTGTDPRGYTLVNSHTADRYRVPWDIGWDRNTGYILLHLRDSASVQAPARYLMPESMPVVRTGCTSPLPAVG